MIKKETAEAEFPRGNKPKKNRAPEKTNPLYIILDELPSQAEFPPQIAVLIEKKEQLVKKNEFFLIDIPSQDPTYTSIFPLNTHQLIRRHVRVDLKYITNHHGFTPAHYTEEYTSLADNIKIVVHAYFNSVGNYTHTRCDLEISEQLVLQNLRKASALLHGLIKYKDNLYKTEYAKSLAIGQNLGTLLKAAYTTKAGLEAYKLTASNFSSCIARINILNEVHIDSRNKEFDRLIKQLEEYWQRKLEISEVPEASVATIQPRAAANGKNRGRKKAKQNTTTISSPQKSAAEFANTRKQTTSYITQINKMLAKNVSVQQLQNLIVEMQTTLINLCDFYHNPYKETAQILQDKLSNAIDQAKDLIQQKIIILMNDGDKISLSTALEFGGMNYVNFDICYDFLKALVSMPGQNETELNKVSKKTAICDLLYKESDVFKIAAHFVAMLHTDIDGNYSISLLLLAYMKQNLPVFQKLIEYGAQTDLGAYSETRKQQVPLLNILLYYQIHAGHQNSKSIDADNFQFIDFLLLQKQPLLSGMDITKNLVVLSAPFNHIANKTAIVFSSPELTPIISYFFNASYKLTPLEICIQLQPQRNFHIFINKLAPISSLKSLALALAFFAEKLSSVCTPSNNQYGVCIQDIKDNKLLTKTMSKPEDPYNKLLYEIFITTEHTTNFTVSLQFLCSKLIEQATDNASINAAIHQISKDCSFMASNDPDTQYQILQQHACLLLLSLKSSLNFDDSFKILKCFNNILIAKRKIDDSQVKINLNYFLQTSRFGKSLSNYYCGFSKTKPSFDKTIAATPLITKPIPKTIAIKAITVTESISRANMCNEIKALLKLR